MEQIKAMIAMGEAIAAQGRALLEQFECDMDCPHEKCALAAGSTMGDGNQTYVCSDCGMEVTEDEYIRSQER